MEILSFAHQSQPDSEIHAEMEIIQHTEYEHAMVSIHVCIQGSPVSLLRCKHSRCAGWLVGGVHSWLLGDQVRRQETVNGFLNSAEQPFAKVRGTSVLLSRGLHRAAHSDQWREAVDTHTRTHTAPPTKHTHMHAHSLCMSYSQSEVWIVSSVTPLRCPIHC